MTDTPPSLTNDTLGALLDQVLTETSVPGIGIEMSVSGRRFSAYRGKAAVAQQHSLSEKSRFEVSCLMKLLVSLVALELSNARLLDLDSPVEEYLPELGGLRNSTSAWRVHHLLSHTSGYLGLDITNGKVKWTYSWDLFRDHFARSNRSFEPGKVFNYEHTEHVILGRIIEKVCSLPAAEVVRQTILDRLGFSLGAAKHDLAEGTSFVGQHAFTPATRSYAPASLPPFCSFWADSLPDATITLGELLSVGEALLATHRGGGRLFTQPTLTALQSAQCFLPMQVTSGRQCEQMPFAYGRGCAHYAGGLMGRNGSMFGQTCTLRFDAGREIAVAVGVNAWSAYTRDTVVSRAIALTEGVIGLSLAPVGAEERTSFDLVEAAGAFPVGDLVGVYVGSYFGQVRVSEDVRGIHFALGTGPKPARVSAVRVDEGQYRLESQVPTQIGFFPDPADGRPALMMGVHAYKKTTENLPV